MADIIPPRAYVCDRYYCACHDVAIFYSVRTLFTLLKTPQASVYMSCLDFEQLYCCILWLSSISYSVKVNMFPYEVCGISFILLNLN